MTTGNIVKTETVEKHLRLFIALRSGDINLSVREDTLPSPDLKAVLFWEG